MSRVRPSVLTRWSSSFEASSQAAAVSHPGLGGNVVTVPPAVETIAGTARR